MHVWIFQHFQKARGREFWGGYKDDHHPRATMFAPTKEMIVTDTTWSNLNRIIVRGVFFYSYHAIYNTHPFERISLLVVPWTLLVSFSSVARVALVFVMSFWLVLVVIKERFAKDSSIIKRRHLIHNLNYLSISDSYIIYDLFLGGRLRITKRSATFFWVYSFTLGWSRKILKKDHL